MRITYNENIDKITDELISNFHFEEGTFDNDAQLPMAKKNGFF